jgi:hypothetical protein
MEGNPSKGERKVENLLDVGAEGELRDERAVISFPDGREMIFRKALRKDTDGLNKIDVEPTSRPTGGSALTGLEIRAAYKKAEELLLTKEEA